MTAISQTIERKNIPFLRDGNIDHIKAEVRGFEKYLAQKYNYPLRLEVSTDTGIIYDQLEKMNIIRDFVFDFYDVDVAYYTKASRIREAVLCRQICMTLCGEVFKIASLKAIGMYFGGRDHSTVVHAKNTINDLCETDSKIKMQFEHLKNVCIGRGL